jgi:hypothetical protein
MADEYGALLMMMSEQKRRTYAKKLSHRHFFHYKSRMFTDLGSNMGLRGERLATTRLNHGAAQ